MTSSRSATAEGFSIFDRIAARPRVSFRSSATSSARCTKDKAIQSTPSCSAASRSLRSLSVIADSGRSVSGRLMPLRSLSTPPTSTAASADRPGASPGHLSSTATSCHG